MKQNWYGIGLSLVILAGSHVLVAQPSLGRYTVTDLSTRGEFESYAFAINSRGQVVGTSDPLQFLQAFFYKGGVTRLLGTLGGSASEAFGINSNGDIVGVSYTLTNDGRRAFLYRAGRMQDLGTLGGTGDTYAQGINDQGQVVGFSSSAAANDEYHAFIYTDAGGMRDLGISGNNGAQAINNRGEIVGWHSGGAYLFSGGSAVDLGGLGQVPGTSGSVALGINDLGWVVGGSVVAALPSDPNPGGYIYHAFLYQDGQMTDLDTMGSLSSEAWGVNSIGQVVGYFVDGGGTPHAFLAAGGSMCDLNSLIPPNSGWFLRNATAINDAGEIVGWGIYQGRNHAFLLTPRSQGAGSNPCLPSIVYYGIGDSVASGHGLPGDPGPAFDPCRHAPNAYPRIVGRALSSLGVTDRGQSVYLQGERRALGCSGARTHAPAPDGVQDKLFSNQVRTAIGDLTRIRHDNAGAQAIVSVTVGANDFPWSSLFDAPKLLCATGPDFLRSTNGIVTQTTASLQGEIDKLRRVGGVKVVLTTYHNPFNRDGFYFDALRALKPCSGLELNAFLYGRIDDATRKLNAALSNIAFENSDLVALADVYQAFNVIGSHESPRALPGTFIGCGNAPPDFGQSWIQAPIRLWQPPFLPSADCFHPNEHGAVEYARSVVNAAKLLLP